FCILGVQALEVRRPHCIRPDAASDGYAGEQMVEDVEGNMPSSGTHGDETAIDAGPQRQASATGERFEFPSHFVLAPGVLERLGSVGPLYDCFGNMQPRCSYGSELYRSANCGKIRIRVKRSPLAQMCRIGERLPDFLRRVAQFADQDEPPSLALFLFHLRLGGEPRGVMRAVGHRFTPFRYAPYQRINCVIWIRLPQVSLNVAILEAVTSVGGIVNSAPRDFIRSKSACRLSVKNMAAGCFCWKSAC